MASEIDSLYSSVLNERHLVPCEPIAGLNPAGTCYRLQPEYGKGYCWEYKVGDSFSVTIIDQVFYEDQFTEFDQPAYLVLGYYETVSGEVLTPYRKLHPKTIHAHVGEPGRYAYTHHALHPVRGVSFTIMPEYYEKHLMETFGEQYRNPKEAFSLVDGASDCPALSNIFMQVKEFKGSGMTASLYYASMLEAALSLVFEIGSRRRGKREGAALLSDEDRELMLSIASYIDDHYSEKLSLKFLAHIACMSKTKLMQSFKAIFHCSIGQYQQSKRVSHADTLLRESDLSLAGIATLVGYKNQGSFSEVYKKHTGMSPREYRNSCRSAGAAPHVEPRAE